MHFDKLANNPLYIRYAMPNNFADITSKNTHSLKTKKSVNEHIYSLPDNHTLIPHGKTDSTQIQSAYPS